MRTVQDQFEIVVPVGGKKSWDKGRKKDLNPKVRRHWTSRNEM